MRICIEKITGKVIEMQCSATAGTLIDNAVSAGYSVDRVEEKEVTAEEWQAILNTPVVLTKAQKLTALKAEYDPQILNLQTQIVIAVSATKNVTAETTWRSSLTSLQAEYNTKRMAILNG